MFLLLYCFCCIATLSDCNKVKCVQHEVAYLPFTEGDRSIIPYTGNEILIFKDTIGDSIIFEKGLKTISSKVEYEYSDHEAEEHNYCRGDYITSENDEIDFYSKIGSGYLQILLFNGAYFKNPKSVKLILFNFQPGDDVSLRFDADFMFSNDTLFNKPNNLDSITGFHHQIIIGSKTFTNVYELYGYNHVSDSNEWYKTAFYSLIDGLVGLRTNSGRLLYLDRKM